MKRIILVILAIFSITMTVDAQSVSIINKTMSFTKKVDGILTADGRKIDVEWPNTTNYYSICIKIEMYQLNQSLTNIDTLVLDQINIKG